MFAKVPQGVDRIQYWINFVREHSFKSVSEIGVWKGEFSKSILDSCPCIREYYLLDPWRKMADWNKPFNFVEDLDAVYEEAMKNLHGHRDKIKVLRGKTIEVISQIPDKSLDFAYIDGDHTLRGIAIDLISILPKMKSGSFIGLDDFYDPLQHGFDYELSLVDPFALYFSEAHGFPCAKLGDGQFCIHINPGSGYSMIDFVEPDRSTPYPDIMTRLNDDKTLK